MVEQIGQAHQQHTGESQSKYSGESGDYAAIVKVECHGSVLSLDP